jgi:hypothetical protein
MCASGDFGALEKERGWEAEDEGHQSHEGEGILCRHVFACTHKKKIEKSEAWYICVVKSS